MPKEDGMSETKRKPRTTDSALEQHYQMGFRAAMQQAINIVVTTWNTFPNRTVKDLSETYERELRDRLVKAQQRGGHAD